MKKEVKEKKYKSGEEKSKEENGNASVGKGSLESVVVHPIVLLSVVDHYNRVAKDIANRRVVGVLLGTISKGVVDITNCYASMFIIYQDAFFFALT